MDKLEILSNRQDFILDFTKIKSIKQNIDIPISNIYDMFINEKEVVFVYTINNVIKKISIYLNCEEMKLFKEKFSRIYYLKIEDNRDFKRRVDNTWKIVSEILKEEK